MMGGIGLLQGHGHGFGLGGGIGGAMGLNSLLYGTQDIRDKVTDRVGALKDDVESGRVDIGHLQARLVERFGDAAKGIVGTDGRIDFNGLVDVITQQRSQDQAKSLNDRLVSLFGNDANGVVGQDGTIDTNALRDLIVAKRTKSFEAFADKRVAKLQERVEAGKVDLAKLQQRLTDKFGDQAAGIVGIDGTVNYDAIKGLIVDQRVAHLNDRLDATFAKNDGVDLQSLRDFIVARKTTQYENTADRLIERLKKRVDNGGVDLEKLQHRLTDRYGEDAAGIVGIDGTIDYGAIKSLYVDNRVEQLQQRLDARFDKQGAVDFGALRDFIVGNRGDRFSALADRIVERLQKRVENGGVDLENLQDRLTDRFGEDAAGIVGIDGTVDYQAIKGLIVDRLTQRLHDRLDGPVSDAGTVDGATLRDLIAQHRTKRFEAFVDRRLARFQERVDAGKVDLDKLQQRLTDRFGEDAAGIVGTDGSVDTDRLKTLIVDQFKERLQARLDQRFGTADTGSAASTAAASSTSETGESSEAADATSTTTDGSDGDGDEGGVDSDNDGDGGNFVLSRHRFHFGDLFGFRGHGHHGHGHHGHHGHGHGHGRDQSIFDFNV